MRTLKQFVYGISIYQYSTFDKIESINHKSMIFINNAIT